MSLCCVKDNCLCILLFCVFFLICMSFVITTRAINCLERLLRDILLCVEKDVNPYSHSLIGIQKGLLFSIASSDRK